MQDTNSIFNSDLLIFKMKVKQKEVEMLSDSGAGYNLMDRPTARRLQLDLQNLPNTMYLNTIAGGRLPIIAKINVLCEYRQKKIDNLYFFVTKYDLAYTILERKGLDTLHSGSKHRLLELD